MHPKKSFAFLLLIVCLASNSVQAENRNSSQALSDKQKIIQAAAAITPRDYPNSDEILVDENIREIYQADGTSTTRDEEYLKVLTEKGKRSLRVQTLHYTLPYGTTAYTLIEVIKPDGSILPVDLKQQSRVMVDRSQMGSNIFNPNQKIMQVTIPQLEVGDLLHLISQRETVKPRVVNTWSSYQLFEYTAPIRHLVYEVNAPQTRPLEKIALKDKVSGTVTYTKKKKGDRILYRWEVKAVPRMFPEPQMPKLHTVVQRLLISTIPDWKDVSAWYWDISKPHLEVVTPAMQEKVKALTAGTSSEEERLLNIFRFVANKIRYMGITTETEAPGYEPHDVKITFENRYGVCRDKAALLVAMLRMAGFQAYPVLLRVGAKMDQDVPQPYFNHAIVAVLNPDKSYTLMDPTDENTKELLPAYLNNRSYLVAREEGETLLRSPIIPAKDNLVKIKSQGRLDASGRLIMESVLQFEGINDNAYRSYAARMKPVERRRFFEGLIKRIAPGSELTVFKMTPENLQDLGEPLVVTLQYEAPDYWIDSQKNVMLAPPLMGTKVGVINFVIGQTGLKKRKYPFETEITCGVEETLDIDLSQAVGKKKVIPQVEALKTEKAVFSLKMDYTSGHLQGKGRFQIEGVEFTPSEYLKLKKLLQGVEYALRKKAIFSALKKEQEQDIEILERRSTTTLQDAHTWQTRLRVKKKILTYAGKKSHSELMLEYNPIWETVELKKAVVKNPDGSTHKISPEEMNVMDASWVGAAPRYPAAKTLVVSLPGVAIGSIIEYEVVKEVKEHPFFAARKVFKGFEPIQREDFKVIAPKKLKLKLKQQAGENVTFRKKKKRDRIEYQWQSTRQASIRKEDGLPPLWSFNPYAFLSSSNWPDYLESVRPALLERTRNQSGTNEKIKSLIKGQKGDEKAITIAIRDFVAKQIKHAGPALTEIPLRYLTPADQTLKEGYGNNPDRAILLYTMLEQAGLKPEFILASWSPLVRSLQEPYHDNPDPDYFGEVLVRVLVDDGYIYLNDSNQYAHLGATPYDRRLGLTLQGNLFTIYSLAGAENQEEAMYTLRIKKNGEALISFQQDYYGTRYSEFQKTFAEMLPEDRDRYFQELVAGLSLYARAEGKLITKYAAYPGQKRFTARVKKYAVRSGNFLYFSLPGGGANLPLALRSDSREQPLYSSEVHRRTMTYKIILPAGMKRILLNPETLMWQGPEKLGSIRYETITTPGKPREITIKRIMEFQPAIIPAGDYPALLEMQREAEHPDQRTVMVEM